MVERILVKNYTRREDFFPVLSVCTRAQGPGVMNEAVKDGRLHHMDAGDIAQTSKTVKASQVGDVYALPQLPRGKKNTQ